MGLKIIAQKNLFSLSKTFARLALWWESVGFETMQKIFFVAWKKCLDARDKIR